MSMMGIFENREQAGRELAKELSQYKDKDCLVVGIPRGGVVVAYEVAQALNAELDVIVPRKIGAPSQPELAIGAVASWGNHERLIDINTVRMLGVSEEYINHTVEQELAEVNRRLLKYRGTTDPPNVAGRCVILVDDGIATGYTTRAAALALHNLDAMEVILAIPVGPPDSIEVIRHSVDDVVVLKTPIPFMAVGYWYRDFAQTTDEEVIHLLKKARERNLA